MSKTYEQVVQELDAKIPRDCISSREGGGRTKLSYLEGHYVIDRLNKVLGQGNWAYSADANVVHTGMTKDKYQNDVFNVHYVTKVRLVVSLPGGTNTEFIDYGYGDGQDKGSFGKAHELAVKESVTDGIKRCAKNLGMSMGLALYDKTQENVEENTPVAAQGPAPRRDITGHIPAPLAAKQGDRDAINKAITANSRVVIAKKLKTVDELKADMRAKYGTDTTASLTDKQAKELLETLKALANG